MYWLAGVNIPNFCSFPAKTAKVNGSLSKIVQLVAQHLKALSYRAGWDASISANDVSKA